MYRVALNKCILTFTIVGHVRSCSKSIHFFCHPLFFIVYIQDKTIYDKLQKYNMYIPL